MTSKVQSILRRFNRNEDGTVAVIFGLMFMVLVLMTGLAVDQGRLYDSNSRLASAADAAALAAGRAMLDGRLTDADVIAIGRAYFEENAGRTENMANVNGVQIVPNRQAGTVTVQVDADVPVTIMKVAGYETVDMTLRSATAFDQRDIELGLALDVTGSMGGSKIADLKAASKDLIDILMPDTARTNKVRIGLAPYAASVNAGGYARTVTNNISTSCVHERSGPQAFTDARPGTGAWIGYTTGMSCPSARIEPITEDKARLKSRIDSYNASGMTAGHLGTAWAWYLVSPEWSSIWPAASRPVDYDDPDTIKAIVLMTDGEFNRHYVSANGNSSAQARSLCGEMKDKGVIVYSVAFQSPATAEALLRDCASSDETYFNARDGDELRGAFQAIALKLNNLRLTQ